VPVGNGNEVSARPAFGLDMRLGVPARGVQQFMPRKPPAYQRHLPAAVKYTDLDKRKRERRMARREDGRATDAKQARMHGRITAVCVESASPSPVTGMETGIRGRWRRAWRPAAMDDVSGHATGMHGVDTTGISGHTV